jgi:hypothetical protein
VNPYQPPSTTEPEQRKDGASAPEIIPDRTLGRRCEKCGSTNISGDDALRTKPSIVAVIFFGWMFLLIRSAFSKRREQCHDCGTVRIYKTTGSKLAMAFLLLLVFVFAISYLESLQSP